MQDKHVKLKKETAINLNIVKAIILQNNPDTKKLTDEQTINYALMAYIKLIGEK